MQQTLKLNLMLRFGAIAVFVLATLLAAILNRPLLLVPLIALAMSGASLIALRRSPLVELANLNAANDDIPKRRPVNWPRQASFFALRLGGLFGVFVVTLGLTALFTETQPARVFGLTDFFLIAVPFFTALTLQEAAARMTATQMAGAMSAFQGMFNEAQGGPSVQGDGPVIEGEVIEIDSDSEPL